MFNLIDIDLAADAHVQRSRSLETRNRLALRDTDHGRTWRAAWTTRALAVS